MQRKTQYEHNHNTVQTIAERISIKTQTSCAKYYIESFYKLQSCYLCGNENVVMRCKNAFQVKWTSSWNLMEAILAEIKHVWKQRSNGNPKR
jgi:hypothetical protein